MAICYHRKQAWITEKGLKFRPVLGARRVTVPCGKCLACRANNASQWATRVMHEAEYVKTACFVTLTYSPEHVPFDYSLRKNIKRSAAEFRSLSRLIRGKPFGGHRTSSSLSTSSSARHSVGNTGFHRAYPSIGIRGSYV